jgi:hypothetical protein
MPRVNLETLIGRDLDLDRARARALLGRDERANVPDIAIGLRRAQQHAPGHHNASVGGAEVFQRAIL